MSYNKRWLFLLMSAFVLTAGAARAGQTLSANKVLAHVARNQRLTQTKRHVNPHLIRSYRARTFSISTAVIPTVSVLSPASIAETPYRAQLLADAR